MPTVTLIGAGSGSPWVIEPWTVDEAYLAADFVAVSDAAMAFDQALINVDPGAPPTSRPYGTAITANAHSTGTLFPMATSGRPVSFTWDATLQMETHVDILNFDGVFDPNTPEVEVYGFETSLETSLDGDELWDMIARVDYTSVRQDPFDTDTWSLSVVMLGNSETLNQDTGCPHFLPASPLTLAMTYDEPSDTASFTVTQGALTATLPVVTSAFTPDAPVVSTHARITVDPSYSAPHDVLAGAYTSLVVTWGEADPCGRITDATWNPAGL